jgi:hypothetical protein
VIAALCNAGKNVQLIAGTYYTGKSNTAMTMSTACSITGAGPGITIIQNEGTTNDVMVINTANVSSTIPPYPSPMPSGGTYSGFTIIEDPVKTATAGAGIRIGTGIVGGAVTFGYTFTSIDVKGTYYGIRFDPGIWRNIFRNIVLSNPQSQDGVYFDSPSPSGDTFIDGMMLIGDTVGTPANFYVNRADTNTFHAVKFNVGKFVFAAGTGISNLKISDTGIEGAATCAFDFSAGNSSNYQLVQISNSEFETLSPITPNPICGPLNVPMLAISNLCTGGGIGNPTKCFNFPIYGFYAYDDLNGIAGSEVNTTETNNIQTWLKTATGIWGSIVLNLSGSGSVVGTGTNTTPIYYVNVQPPAGNYTVTVPCTLGGTAAGWCQAWGRITSPAAGTTQGYACIFIQGTGVELLKWSGAGSNAQIGSTYSGISTGTHTVGLVMLGSALSCTLDGISVSGPSGTDTTYTGGFPGIQLNITSAGYSINGPVTVK